MLIMYVTNLNYYLNKKLFASTSMSNLTNFPSPSYDHTVNICFIDSLSLCKVAVCLSLYNCSATTLEVHVNTANHGDK